MNDTLIVAVGGIIVSALAYFAGQQRADRRSKKDRAGESERERKEQLRALMTKMVDEFVSTVRRHRADGPYALALLGLEALRSDELIREAIAQMKILSASDPWLGQGHHVDDIDLVTFFRIVRQQHVDFAKTTVEEAAKRVREEASHYDETA